MVSLLILLDLAVMATLAVARVQPESPWLGASPSLIAGSALAADWFSPLHPLASGAALDLLAAVLASAALGLVLAAVAAPALPGEIRTRGPYGLVRHPLASALLMALGAATLCLPHLATLTALAWGVFAATRAALREERALLASPLAERYRAHVAATGRFIPRWRSRS